MKNDTQDIYNEFFEGITNKREAELLVEQLEKFRTALFNTKEEVREKITRLFTEGFKIKLISLAHSLGVGENDAIAFEKLVLTLAAQLKNMETLSLTLAFDPTDATVRKISNWLREAAGRRFLLDITVDPHVVGGAVLSRGGEYHDYSLKKIIEEKYGKERSMPKLKV